MDLFAVQGLIVWIFTQGFVGIAVSWIAELPVLNKIKKGWKLSIVVALCLIASFLQLVGLNTINLTSLKLVDWNDIAGLAILILTGSQIWYLKIVKPMTKKMGDPLIPDKEKLYYK